MPACCQPRTVVFPPNCSDVPNSSTLFSPSLPSPFISLSVFPSPASFSILEPSYPFWPSPNLLNPAMERLTAVSSPKCPADVMAGAPSKNTNSDALSVAVITPCTRTVPIDFDGS